MMSRDGSITLTEVLSEISYSEEFDKGVTIWDVTPEYHFHKVSNFL